MGLVGNNKLIKWEKVQKETFTEISTFWAMEVKYLGCWIIYGVIKPLSKKTYAIMDLEPPTNLKYILRESTRNSEVL